MRKMEVGCVFLACWRQPCHKLDSAGERMAWFQHREWVVSLLRLLLWPLQQLMSLRSPSRCEVVMTFTCHWPAWILAKDLETESKFFRLLPVPLSTFYLPYFKLWNNRRGKKIKSKASKCCKDDEERRKRSGKLGWQGNDVEIHRSRKA